MRVNFQLVLEALAIAHKQKQQLSQWIVAPYPEPSNMEHNNLNTDKELFQQQIWGLNNS